VLGKFSAVVPSTRPGGLASSGTLVDPTESIHEFIAAEASGRILVCGALKR